ncbi:MAG: hypothetical protein M1830_002276 [Pleopsidium flavum]|nr:MAG: hypothetical protein M1830_002276 [Pleopsidium flavum]
MERVRAVNPFAKRESHTRESLIAYKALTILSWLLVLVCSVLHTFYAPGDGKPSGHHANRTIWGQNKAHPTPFALNEIITSLYWIILLLLQVGYVWHLFSNNADWVKTAANVGSHFIINNLLQSAFILLWVRSRFLIAELMLVINFFNLTSLYLRHPTTLSLVHIPVVSGPLAWTFIALFWDGAAMVGAHSLPARIIANVAIWAILGYGTLFLVAFKDYTIGFELTILSASLAVGQLMTKAIAFQWIFAFVIMGLLLLFTLAIAVPSMFGKELIFTRDGDVVDEERERRPLLDDE